MLLFKVLQPLTYKDMANNEIDCVVPVVFLAWFVVGGRENESRLGQENCWENESRLGQENCSEDRLYSVDLSNYSL